MTFDTSSGLILKETGLHNHNSKLDENSVNEVVSRKVDEAVKNPNIPPRKILQDITNEIREVGNSGDLGLLPSHGTLAKRINEEGKPALVHILFLIL